jgi:chaperonin GroEL
MSSPIKDVRFNEDAKAPLINGINTVCNAVSTTMGYRGRTVLIESAGGFPNPTKDGVSVAKSIFLDDAVESLGCEFIKQACQKTVDEAGDGPQPLYSKILTTSGWKTMGEMEVGSEICGTNGTKQNVVGVFPKGEMELYKVYFSGGSVVECSKNHLWSVTTKDGSKKVIPLSSMIDNYVSLKSNGSNNYRYFVQNTKVEFNDGELYLDPYLLGLLLGDGSLSGSGSIELSIGFNKEHVLDKIKLPEGIVFTAKRIDRKNYIRVKFTGCDKNGRYMKDILNDIGLLGSLSENKFIPKNYLYSSIENREMILKGLLDTDGYINSRNLFEYSTTSENLCNDVVELSRSLGHQISFYKMERKENSSYSNKSIYRITQLKGYKYGDKIIKIEKVGNKVEMMCIKVSNEDSLYITNDYTVTHNTTTTAVLAQKLIEVSNKYVESGESAIDIKNGMERAKNEIVEYIKSKAMPVQEGFIYDVARISSNNDEELGKVISEAFLKAGKNGVVSYEESENELTYVEFIDGMPIERGWEFEGFVNVPEKRMIEFNEKPYVLLSNRKIQAIKEILPFLEVCFKENKELLIISEMEYEVMKTLHVNKKNNGLKVAVINPPSIAEKRRDYLSDIKLATGGLVVDIDTNTNLESYDPKDILGKCDKISVSKTDTVLFFKELENSEEIKSKINELEEVVKNSSNRLEKEYLKDRVAKLACGVSIVKVGGNTESELKEKIDRVDDAIHAVRAAISEGVVIGGGMTLFNSINALKKNDSVGYKVLSESLSAPFKTILSNAGVSLSEKDFSELDALYEGYDVKDYKMVVNMVKSGIIDPAKVVRCALENAISVASTVLMTNVAITYKREK